MSQNVSHHFVRLFIPLLVENFLLVIPDPLQEQVLIVFSSPSANLCLAFLIWVGPEPFQAHARLRLIFLNWSAPNSRFPSHAGHHSFLCSNSNFHMRAKGMLAPILCIFCVCFPPQSLYSCRISDPSTWPCPLVHPKFHCTHQVSFPRDECSHGPQKVYFFDPLFLSSFHNLKISNFFLKAPEKSAPSHPLSSPALFLSFSSSVTNHLQHLTF